MTPDNLDLIAGWVSLVLTLMIFSYLLGDNFLYRIAVHLLVGVAAGYTVVITAESVIVPWLNNTVLVEAGEHDASTTTALRTIGMIPFLFGVLLLFKVSPRLAPVGNLGLAVILGVGIAVTMVGAITGTVIPLARETGQTVGTNTGDGMVMIVGVITTLIYFQYSASVQDGELRQWPTFRFLGTIGKVFIMLTLGALYAGAILTSLSVFSNVTREQLEFILDKVWG